MKKEKEVKKEDFYFTIFELLKKGFNPSKICSKLNLSKQRVNYYIRRFKEDGSIKRVGYGTWEVETSKNTSATNSALEVRGHAFAFKIPLKNLKNWENKKELLESRKINFKVIHNNILRLVYKNHKVWLSNKAIIIFFPQDKSYFAETSERAVEKAIYDLKLLCNGLFRFIGLNLEKFEYNIIKFHFSLTDNELAKDYNQRKDKLYLEFHGKRWGLIDNSLNLNEFETISKTAKEDNKIVQVFFNDLKEHNPPTNSQLAYLVQGVTNNQVMFDKNFQSHLDILNRLGKAVDNLTETVKSLEKAHTSPSA